VKNKVLASLGIVLSMTMANSVLASELRPENYDSLIPADDITAQESLDLTDFDEVTDFDIDAMRPGRPGGPGVGRPGGGGGGRPGFPGGGGGVRPGFPGGGGVRPGFPGGGGGGRPGFPGGGVRPQPGPGWGRPGHGRPGWGHPGHGPGWGNPSYGGNVQCYAEDNYGNWYSSFGSRYNANWVQQVAVQNCQSASYNCYPRGCRYY